MVRFCKAALCLAIMLAMCPAAAQAQKSVADVLGQPATPEGQPKSYLEELMLYSYIENSYVANLRDAGRGGVNELRFYDHAGGFTFNAAELSVKKDPSERYRFGYGAVITAGIDSQKNHSLGIFRDADDGAPFYRNTEKFDLPEAYVSYLVPLGSGLTLKAGKWATLIGYEVYESPKNLNFSRSFLYTLGTPYTNTGLLVTYPFTKWIAATLGFTMGWDNSDNPNGYLKATGQVVFTPTDKFSITSSFHVGPEQIPAQTDGHVNQRWIVDTTILYTGIERWIFAVNFDFAGEENDPVLVALGTRKNNNSNWSGIAGYAAYDWTKSLRTALRLEYFADPQAVRNGITPPGHNVNYYEFTPTAQFRIWRGLIATLEYRRDMASRNSFSRDNFATTPTTPVQNTFSIVVSYIFF